MNLHTNVVPFHKPLIGAFLLPYATIVALADDGETVTPAQAKNMKLPFGHGWMGWRVTTGGEDFDFTSYREAKLAYDAGNMAIPLV